jgi:hypothetical protein
VCTNSPPKPPETQADPFSSYSSVIHSPLLLARRKAQYFSSLLKDTLRQKTGSTPKGAIPYVQELVVGEPNERNELTP